MNFYVYVAKIDGVPVYVGKGSKQRYKHCYKRWPNCIVDIICVFDKEDDAYAYEYQTIRHYGRLDEGKGTLHNKCNGGKYIKAARYWAGKQKTDSIKQKVSNKLKEHWHGKPRHTSGKPGTFSGRKHTEAARLKNSMSNRGRPSPMKDRRHTEEAKLKNRMAHLGKVSPKKIALPYEVVEDMYFTKGLTMKKISHVMGCSLTPVRRVIRDIKDRR